MRPRKPYERLVQIIRQAPDPKEAALFLEEILFEAAENAGMKLLSDMTGDGVQSLSPRAEMALRTGMEDAVDILTDDDPENVDITSWPAWRYTTRRKEAMTAASTEGE